MSGSPPKAPSKRGRGRGRGRSRGRGRGRGRGGGRGRGRGRSVGGAGAGAGAGAGGGSSDYESGLTPSDLDLKPYDFNREPRLPVVTDDRTIEVPYLVVNEQLQCPVCFSIVRDACLVMECLHRFCRECIQKCLRLGKKECPACRTHVPSRRSTKPDPAFDALIRKIYPDLDAFEAEQAAAISNINMRENFSNAFTEGVAEAEKIQKTARRKRAPRMTTATPRERVKRPRDSAVPPAAQPALKRRQTIVVPTVAGFVLKPHPRATGVDGLARPYLRTSKHMKVLHIKMYLEKKLGTPRDYFLVTVTASNSIMECPDGLSVNDLYQKYWAGDIDRMVLHYAVKPAGSGHRVLGPHP